MVSYSEAAAWAGIVALGATQCAAFLPFSSTHELRASTSFIGKPASTSHPLRPRESSTASRTQLRMGLDLVTYLRCEYISAALCTNQIPRAADVCLELGTDDGRAVTFIPKTVRELVTSSAESDGKVTLSARRALKLQQERRKAANVQYIDQPSDDLCETKDESVDVVISLQAAERMRENGLDWKRSVREAARVLKPGGRFLFVEQTTIDGDEYLEYAGNLLSWKDEDQDKETPEGEEIYPIFECIGFDDVDLVITPHVAGVFVKSEDAGMTPEERKAKEAADAKAKEAELSINAFERGLKKRKKKKKKAKKGSTSEATETA